MNMGKNRVGFEEHFHPISIATDCGDHFLVLTYTTNYSMRVLLTCVQYESQGLFHSCTQATGSFLLYQTEGKSGLPHTLRFFPFPTASSSRKASLGSGNIVFQSKEW